MVNSKYQDKNLCLASESRPYSQENLRLLRRKAVPGDTAGAFPSAEENASVVGVETEPESRHSGRANAQNNDRFGWCSVLLRPESSGLLGCKWEGMAESPHHPVNIMRSTGDSPAIKVPLYHAACSIALSCNVMSLGGRR